MSKPKIISRGSKLVPVKDGSKKHLILSAMLKSGVNISQIEKLTGWARSAASSAVRTDIIPTGVRITLHEGVYRASLPKGAKVSDVVRKVLS